MALDKSDDETALLTFNIVNNNNEPTNNNNKTERVEIIAPSNLPEGYAVRCMLNGQEFNVLVPEGGVKEGESFVGQVQWNFFNIPEGRWRDGTCSCAKYGWFHPMCWYGFCCCPLVLAQVMTRMHLNICGQPGNPPATNNTFLCMAIIFLVFVFLETLILQLLLRPYFGYNILQPDQVMYLRIADVCIILSFKLWMALTIIWTRKVVRERYRIPGTTSEDCFCGCCCQCCTTTQMARHTYDYQRYDVACCSADCLFLNTGMSARAPRIV